MLRNQRIPHGDVARLHPVTCAILIAPCDYEPRVQWSVAHELAETYTADRIEPELHEAYCDRVAAALLMPRERFIRSAKACGLRLPQLRQVWPSCSREAIVSRIANLFPNTVASSWRGNRFKFRRTSDEYQPPELATELEAFCAAEAAYHRRESWVREGNIGVRAWPAAGGRALALCVAA